MDGKQLLHSRAVLYIVSIISLLHILYYARIRNVNATFIFLIVAFLTSFFSKNMIVILLIALLVSHLLRCDMYASTYEGAENMDAQENMEADLKANLAADKASAGKSDQKFSMDTLPADVKAKSDSAAKDASSGPSDSANTASLEKKKELYDKLKKDFVEFQSIQQNILAGMKEIDPLLSKAESFITKFEAFGKDMKKN